MITSWDDYFIHQTQHPVIQTIVETPNWIDRFYWNAQAANGSIMFGTGLGQYRTTSRMDSIVYFLKGSEQRILRLGRQTTEADYTNPSIGPLTFEIVEPMKKWRWVLEENPTGVTWDLTFQARWSPVDYRQFEFDNEGGTGSNYHHFVQLGTTEGSVQVDGQSVDFGGVLHTSRDRSWGVRRSREGQGLLLWLQQRFADVEITLILIEARDGSVTYFDGKASTSTGQVPLVAVGHDLRMDPATRDMLGGTLEVRDANGTSYRIEYAERLLRGYVGGIGYGGWQGKDRGAFFAESDRIDMTRPTEEILASQPMHLFAHLMKVRLDGSEETVGDLEGGITRSPRYSYRPRPLSEVH
jgi:hypothetical protein